MSKPLEQFVPLGEQLWEDKNDKLRSALSEQLAGVKSRLSQRLKTAANQETQQRLQVLLQAIEAGERIVTHVKIHPHLDDLTVAGRITF